MRVKLPFLPSPDVFTPAQVVTLTPIVPAPVHPPPDAPATSRSATSAPAVVHEAAAVCRPDTPLQEPTGP